MQSNTESANPYAAPAIAENTPDTKAPHSEFQLINDRIISRTGLVLPAFCLVTGDKDDLVPHVVSLHAPGKGMTVYRWWGVGLMLGTPLVFMLTIFLMNLMKGNNPNTSWVGALFLLIPLMLIVGLVLFLLGGRGGSNCSVSGFVQRRRQVWQRRMVWIPALTLPVYLLVPRVTSAMDDATKVFLILVTVTVMNLIPIIFLRGLRLRAVATGEGLFEIRGFSKVFLKKLQSPEQVDAQKPQTPD